MRSTKITSVTKHPKSRPSLGLFKDSVDNKIKVFDERGKVEELSTDLSDYLTISSAVSYKESQIQEQTSTVNSLDSASGQYFAAVGVQTVTNKCIYKVNLTISTISLTFPNSTGVNGSQPLKFWFEMFPPSGETFNQHDFFTVHYSRFDESAAPWYYTNNNPVFNVATVRQYDDSIYLMFQVAAGTLQSGTYTIVHHKVTA